MESNTSAVASNSFYVKSNEATFNSAAHFVWVSRSPSLLTELGHIGGPTCERSNLNEIGKKPANTPTKRNYCCTNWRTMQETGLAAASAIREGFEARTHWWFHDHWRVRNMGSQKRVDCATEWFFRKWVNSVWSLITADMWLGSKTIVSYLFAMNGSE
jgi:hypothetical protein